VEGAIMAMAITMMTARVTRTSRGGRKELGKGRKHRIARQNRRRLRTGRGRGMQQRMGRERYR